MGKTHNAETVGKAPHRTEVERTRKDDYNRVRILQNEADAELRAIRDCQQKIERLLAKKGKVDIDFYERNLQNHKISYAEIMNEIHAASVNSAPVKGNMGIAGGLA